VLAWLGPGAGGREYPVERWQADSLDAAAGDENLKGVRMTIRIIRKDDLAGTNRNVRAPTYETTRFLLANDGFGVTVTDIVLKPGVEAEYGYDDHIEIAYCISGKAVLTETDGTAHDILPGTLWVADKGSHFRFSASEPTRLICVFNPALAGHETGYAGDQ
jgi:L-ectoine synthase